MKSLIESLYNNHVVFSYYGFIDASVLNDILQITRGKLKSNGETEATVNKVCASLNECGENTIKHNFYPEDSRVKYKSLLVISKQSNHYLIDTINVVSESQKQIITDQLEYLKTCNLDQLNELKQNSETLIHNNHVSKGLIDLMLKVDGYECVFKDVNQASLFNIKYKVNFLN
jgi:hypothetical protein